MKSLTQIQNNTFEQFKNRAIFAGINPEDLKQNIDDITSSVAIETAQAIKSAELKKKIIVLDTEKKTEDELNEWFAALLLTHDVTSIDQIGKHRFSVTTVEHAPDLV